MSRIAVTAASCQHDPFDGNCSLKYMRRQFQNNALRCLVCKWECKVLTNGRLETSPKRSRLKPSRV